jgi:peptidoglycan/LPS O-acetylase OafA/YrhL
MVSYRKDIDGLRGIAVLPVILYHYKIPGFEGGFTGVDIFFVISGYLIGSIILSGLTENTFSFAGFYERRIRRIIPAFYTVIFTSLLFAFFFLDSAFLKELAQTAASAVLLFSNVFFYKTIGSYFAPESGGNILLHTWSLSVEEQFYLVFPPFIYLLYKYVRRYLILIIGIVALASLAGCILLTKDHVVFSFYLPFTRSWEFLAGVLVARIPVNTGNRLLKEALSLTGVALIVTGIVALDTNSIFPGYNALLPVTGAALLLQYGPGTRIANRILSFGPLVFTGKISYSLYLWHLPVIAFSEYFIYDTFKPSNIIIPLLVTFALSIISWRYIEQPFRLKKQFAGNYKKVFGYAALAFVCLAGICVVIDRKGGFPDRSLQNKMLEEMRTDSYTSHKKLWPYFTHLMTPDSISRHLAMIGDTQTTPGFILWGDSHAGKLLPMFEAACRAKHISGYGAITLAYPPVLTARTWFTNDKVPAINSAVFHFITTHPDIKKVFLVSRWTVHHNLSLQHDQSPVFDEELVRTVDTLAKTGREVILFTPVPELKTWPKKYFFQSILLHKDINSLTPTRADYFSNNKPMLDLMARLDSLPHVKVVATYDFFFQDGRTLLADHDHLLYIDKNHLSQAGAARLKGLIARELP